MKKVKNRITDKHVLYEKSVQTPESDVRFMKRIFNAVRGRKPEVLREDFCGTAALCCDWVKSIPKSIAYGIDLDQPTLDWGFEHNVSRLGDKRTRVKLIHGNVLDSYKLDADVVAAFNFSYFCFKRRKVLVEYCKRVRTSLKDDGIFFMDIFGGPSAQIVQEEETEHDDFSYFWDQSAYNPVTGEILCYIHFGWPDGKRMRKAFTYDWRLWTIPEMTDVLYECGYSDVQVYWEGTDTKTGEGNGVFRRTTKGDDAEAYVAYIAALM